MASNSSSQTKMSLVDLLVYVGVDKNKSEMMSSGFQNCSSFKQEKIEKSFQNAYYSMLQIRGDLMSHFSDVGPPNLTCSDPNFRDRSEGDQEQAVLALQELMDDVDKAYEKFMIKVKQTTSKEDFFEVFWNKMMADIEEEDLDNEMQLEWQNAINNDLKDLGFEDDDDMVDWSPDV